MSQDEPCVHERDATGPLARFFYSRGLPCVECEREARDAWIEGVRAKLTAGLEAAARGERYDWNPTEPPQSTQPEYPPARAWPRTAGVHHVLPDESAHPVGECTDACHTVGGPYAARPGWIVRVQSFTPLRAPDAGGVGRGGRQ